MQIDLTYSLPRVEAKTIQIKFKGLKIRGSVYYQSSQLVKQVFEAGAKKEDRVNPNHEHYQKVASYKTMESYRSIWNNFFNYLKEHWNLKDCEKIGSHHIQAYMDYKIEYYPSKQYLEKISAAIGKLELALNLFSKNIHGEKKAYDFSIRHYILNEARDLKYVANNYHNRAYSNPELLIQNLANPLHKIAAKTQYEGGARIEGIALIKPMQIKELIYDSITNSTKGVVETKEKGGKVGNVFIEIDTYKQLLEYLSDNISFKINKQKYYNDLKQAAIKIKEIAEASHGLRWNFAKRRMQEYAQAGYSYQDSLQGVSNEMKHNRASITEHYLC